VLVWVGLLLGLDPAQAGWSRDDFSVSAYEGAGNRTRKLEDGQEVQGYAWDHRNRLVSVSGVGAGSGAAYEYDYRMRRVTRQEAGVATAVSYVGGVSAVERQGAQVTVEQVRGPDLGGGVGGLLYSVRAGQARFSLANGRGDVVAQADQSGTVTWTGSYEGFGTRTEETGTNLDRQRANWLPKPVRIAASGLCGDAAIAAKRSKEEDPTGLLNEGFRYRDLETGTWLSRDPAGFVDGPNLYAYVQQNPWTKFDPDGLFWSALVTVGFAAYDTFQYATGNISGADYSGRMALNGASLLADAATGGMGGGMAVRTAAMAARAGKAGTAILKTAIAVDKADTVVSTAQAAISVEDAVENGEYGRAALSAVQVGLSAKQTRKNAEELADGMRPKEWSPTHSQNQKLTKESEQSHHIVQDAAVGNVPGYSRGTAPTTKMEGGSHAPDSPHDIANRIQNNVPDSMRGTYGGERDVAYLTMRAAGQTRGTAKANLERSDKYFKDELRVTNKTPTRNPNSD